MSNWTAGGGDWTSGAAAPTEFNTQDEWNGSATAAGFDWNQKGAADAFQDGDNYPAGDASAISGERLCFRCQQPGHTKAECVNEAVERPFQGTCRTCNEEGHMSKDCPNRIKNCNQCGQEGHETIDCKNNKVIDLTNVPVMTEREAWELIREASDDLDVGDFKDALRALSKANPKLTYVDIETELRKRQLLIYLIALQKDVDPAYTNTNLQGEVGKTYTLGVFTKSGTCPRPVLMEAWPKGSEDNMNRLVDAGVPLVRGIPVCANCGEVGHVRKACKQESTAPERKGPTCVLCDEEGHYARDCTSERKSAKSKKTCRFCESEDHLAAECPDKPARKPIECRNCLQEGHRAAECENERVVKCRNCDGIGHVSRDCPEPKNWDKVQCRHCGAMGHASEARCDPATKAAFAAAQAEKLGDAGGFGDESVPVTGDGGWNNSSDGFSKTGDSSWDQPAPVVTAGGW